MWYGLEKEICNMGLKELSRMEKVAKYELGNGRERKGLKIDTRE